MKKNKLYKITTCLYSIRSFVVKAASETQARRRLYNFLSKNSDFDHKYIFSKMQTKCSEVSFEDKVVQIS